MATEIVGRGLIEILPDFRKWGKQLTADMRVAKTQLDGSTGSLKRAAATVAPAMAKIGKGVSLVGVGVAIAATKMAGDFQAETAVLQTAAGETSKNLGIVRTGIKDISKGTGTGLKNLTDGMYTIEKAGFRGAGGLKVLQAAAQGAREENANLADVTNAMTSVMASYHLKTTDSVRVMNALKTSAGEGKITMEEFSGALSTVLPIASANKISFEQVGGAIATLTQHGTSAREATQELAATIRQLAAPNNVASREMARFGLSAVDVSQNLGKRGLTGTFDLLTSTILSKMGPSGKVLLSAFEGTKQSAQDAQIMLDKMPTSVRALAKSYQDGKISAGDWTLQVKDQNVQVQPMLRNFKTLVDRSRGFSRELKSGGPSTKTYTDALKKMSGGAIGLNTILQLTGESMPGFKERVKKTGESFHNASKDVEGWGVTQNLFNVKLDRFKQTLQVLAVDIGTKLLPVVGSFFGFFSDHQTTLMVFVGAMAGLGAVFAGVYVGMKVYAVGAALVTTVQWAWTVATLAQTDSLIALRAELFLLAIAQKASAVAQGIATAATWAWSVALNSTGIPLLIIGIAALVAAIVYVALKTTWFQTAWKYTWSAIKAAAEFVWRGLKPVWDGLVTGFNAVVGAGKAVLGWFQKWWPLVVSLITGPIGFAVVVVIRHWDKIYSALKDTFNAVVGFFAKVGGWILGALGDLGALLYNQGKRLLLGLLRGSAEVAITVGTWLNNHLVKPVVNFFAPAVTWLYNAGRNLLLGLLRGSYVIGRTIATWFRNNVLNPVTGFFRNVGIWLYNAGRNLLLGFLRGSYTIGRTIVSWFRKNVVSPVTGAFSRAGSWLYNNGKALISGLISGAQKGLSGIGKWAKNVFNSVVGAIKHVFGIKSPSTVMAGLGGHMMSGLMRGLLRGSGVLNSVVKKIFSNPLNAAKALIKKGINVTGFLGKGAAGLMSKLFGISSNGGGGGGGGVQRWAGMVEQILALIHQPTSLVGTVLKRMNQESGGNPNAINNWDINAKNGDPSRGLMQTIGSTFNAYAGPYRSRGIYDPFANIYASLKYAMSRYGSISNAFNRPGGYDSGGWLPTGLNLTENKTGKPERILTDKQWDALAGGGGLTVNVYVGALLGTSREIENAVIEALDTARKRGRWKPA